MCFIRVYANAFDSTSRATYITTKFLILFGRFFALLVLFFLGIVLSQKVLVLVAIREPNPDLNSGARDICRVLAAVMITNRQVQLRRALLIPKLRCVLLQSNPLHIQIIKVLPLLTIPLDLGHYKK
jgi:hypothetical protein